MNQQLKVLAGQRRHLRDGDPRRRQDDDNTQIADIDYFINEGNCDVFIISPNSTAAMTPAVERACETGKPVVVFDRGVRDRLRHDVHPPDRWLRVGHRHRQLPRSTTWRRATRSSRCGSCRASTCWRPAGPRPRRSSTRTASRRSTTSPAPTRPRSRRSSPTSSPRATSTGVWMDAGDGAVAAIEAFEDAGVDYPVMTGEDEMSFLRKWEETGLTGLAPVYSNFQWRTPLLAMEKIFEGEEVPQEWVLPQVPITEDERARLPRGQRRHARRPLRQVRRRGPARLPGGLAGALRSRDRPGRPWRDTVARPARPSPPRRKASP